MKICAKEMMLSNSSISALHKKNMSGMAKNNNINFGAKSHVVEAKKTKDLYDGIKQFLGIVAIIATTFVALVSLLTKCSNKELEKNVQNHLYNNMISQDSENGMEITDNELKSFHEAMDFYKQNVKKPKISLDDSHDKNLVKFIKNSTLPNSDAGMKITEQEKISYNYAQQNNLKIEEQYTINEIEANKNKEHKTVEPVFIPSGQ